MGLTKVMSETVTITYLKNVKTEEDYQTRSEERFLERIEGDNLQRLGTVV